MGLPDDSSKRPQQACGKIGLKGSPFFCQTTSLHPHFPLNINFDVVGIATIVDCDALYGPNQPAVGLGCRSRFKTILVRSKTYNRCLLDQWYARKRKTNG
jgi:hypothetical protein